MFGEGDAAPSRDAALALATDACGVGLPAKLVAKLGMLDFESRKDGAAVRQREKGEGRARQRGRRRSPRARGKKSLTPAFLLLPQVLGAIFRMNVDGVTPGANYLAAHPEVVTELMEG